MDALQVIQLLLVLIAVAGTAAQGWMSKSPGWWGLSAYLLSVLLGMVVA